MSVRNDCRPTSGFTVTELLVVIAVIALVVSLVVSAAGPLRQNARNVQDLTQLRTLAQAINSYASDQAGRLPNPRTRNESAAQGYYPLTNAWVHTGASGGVVDGWDTEKSLAAGSLWPYVNAEASIYKSPFDTKPRVRSYSMSGFVGTGGLNVDLEDDHPNRWCDEWFTQFGKNTSTLARIPQPSNTLAFIGEEDPTANFNEFGWVHPPIATAEWLGQWIDRPATWSGNSINIGLVDGSTQSLKILSPRLRLWFADFSHNGIEDPPYVAWRIMQQYMLPGVY